MCGCDSQNREESANSGVQLSDHANESLSKQADDVIYEGGLEDKDSVFRAIIEDDDACEVLDDGIDNCEVEVRGIKYRIPVAIECHLCNEMMNLCLRRTRYRGQAREYPAYRCNRKGCQTFRSIRKVFGNCMSDVDNSGDATTRTMIYHPPHKVRKTSPGEFSDDDSKEFVVQRVYIPKIDNRNKDQSVKSLSVTDRMRKANQDRAIVFSEFADQLRRDIVANKRVRIKKHVEEDQQGTLFYISKELNPQEVIELQDVIIKTLISMRKIPPPMTMDDLPLFANCPYSKKAVDAGLAKSQNDFWIAFANSAQPPLPAGFIKRSDDTLIYRDPRPYVVPEILKQNSPRKQANAVASYHERKIEQDAIRMKRRQVEKKCRSFASLKREFDMSETEERPRPKLPKTIYQNTRTHSDSLTERSRHFTYDELKHSMEANAEGPSTCRIGISRSERNSESLQWIGLKTYEDSTDGFAKSVNSEGERQQGINGQIDDEVFEDESRFKPVASMQDVMRTLSTPSTLRPPVSPLMKSFSSMDSSNFKNPINAHPPMFFSDPHFLINNNQFNSPTPFYALNSYFPSFPMDSSQVYQNATDEHFTPSGASEVVCTEQTPGHHFTYIHPDSGVRLTDPSAFLTSFVPSPITKVPPINFNDETSRSRSASAPSTSVYNTGEFERSHKKYENEEDEKLMDNQNFSDEQPKE